MFRALYRNAILKDAANDMSRPYSEMPTVLEGLAEEEVRVLGLVMLSAGIEYRAVRRRRGWELRVGEASQAAALGLVRQYLQENPDFTPRAKAGVGRYASILAGGWGALVILAVHAALAAGRDGRSFAAAYGASARRILDGEWYRCVTSLLLHADTVHLLGNMAGLVVFGGAVSSVMGWGVGWAMILAAGAAGNLANAWFYETGHVSIGASTAVFGAVGLLSARQFMEKIRETGRRYRAFVPIGAGFALLAFLGAAVRTDIMGHLFGFAAGLAAGMPYGYFVRRPARGLYQWTALIMALVVLTVAWMLPVVGG